MTTNCPARYIAMVVKHLESEGFDCTQVLSEAGISRQSFEHLDAVFPLETQIRAGRLLTELSGRPDIFLATGMRCGPAQYGELGRAILSCATLHDSIELTARYYSLVTTLTSMYVTVSNGVAEIGWIPLVGQPYDQLILSFDFVLGAFYNRLVLILGEALPDFEVHFSMAAPTDASRYRRLKGGRIYFSQGGLPSMRLRIDADVLRKPMPLANPIMLKQAEERVALHHKLVQHPQRDWKAWVHMMLYDSVGHQPTLEELAVIANVSPSTLTRHLAIQGCNFRQLGSEIRHARACAMLREHGMRVSDVAQALGYTAVANFIRAFKAQAGVSPTQFATASCNAPSSHNELLA